VNAVYSVIDASANGQFIGRILASEGERSFIRDVPISDCAAVDDALSAVESTFGSEAAGIIQAEFHRVAGEHAKTHADAPKSADKTQADLFNGPPIPLEPPKPPELQSGIFPGVFGEMVDGISAAVEVPPELAAVFVLASLAIAVQGRFSVRPESDYFEPLCFWAVCALPSGSRKSEVMRLATQWAWTWQREKYAGMEAEIKAATANDAILTGRIKAIRQKAAKAKDETEFALLKSQADTLEKERLPIPVAPRILTEDVTPEHLGTMLSQHAERMGIISDESGPLDNWSGRYYSHGGANLDLALKCYSGIFAAVDRGSRPAVQLAHPLFTVGLSPQPAVIANLVSNDLYRRRGLPGRMWIFVPQSTLGFRRLNGNPIRDEIKERYAQRLTALLETPTPPDGHPHPLSLIGDAWRAWKNFAVEIEAMMRPGGSLERMTDWAGKLPGGTARVAGLFHLAVHGPDALRVDVIELDSMTRAIALARVAIGHAKIVFDSMSGTSELESARQVWREVQGAKQRQDRQERYGDSGIISARDLWHPHRGSFKSVLEFEPVIRLLVDHNHLAELPNSEIGKAGRPSRRFRIHASASEAE
jgi:hypothetical protein